MNKTDNSDARRAAQGQLDAYNNRDIEDFCRWYTDDVQLITLENNEVFCNGKIAMRERYSKMFENMPLLHCELLNRVVCGDFAFDEESVTGLVSDTAVHAVAIYEVRNGLIAKAWFVREKM